MTADKHTPGPWVVFLDGGHASTVMPAGRPGDICVMEAVGHPETDANAALIAAAPDLLAACEEYMREGDKPHVDELMTAAIAKVRG